MFDSSRLWIPRCQPNIPRKNNTVKKLLTHIETKYTGVMLIYETKKNFKWKNRIK